MDTLQIASFNMHGFNSSWHYLQQLLESHDILFLQEHWLSPSQLHYLDGVNSNFIVYCKSSMESKCSSGILQSRPFGGVSVMFNKNLRCNVSYSASDADCRIICITILGDCGNTLVLGCYFPCDDHSQNYVNIINYMLGFIDSVLNKFSDSKCCIVGDFYFECKPNCSGYRLF